MRSTRRSEKPLEAMERHAIWHLLRVVGYFHESPRRVEAARRVESWLKAFDCFEWNVKDFMFLSMLLGASFMVQSPHAIPTCKASRTVGMVSPVHTMEVGVTELIVITWQPSAQLAEKSFRIRADM